jgi:hypothetical protein
MPDAWRMLAEPAERVLQPGLIRLADDIGPWRRFDSKAGNDVSPQRFDWRECLAMLA